MLKKHLFGDDHEIRYDSIINHDAYKYLRVSLEVPRGQDTEALVLLNGKEIGKVMVERDGKRTVCYYPFRKDQDANIFYEFGIAPCREMGKAIGAIISDYVV